MAPEPTIGRQNLPIPDAHQPYPGLVTYDAKDPATSFAPTEELRPPAGAPNVLVVLLDDVGFAASSAFGGPCDTPVAERLAAGGLKYTRFHTTALCAPTRQALLTGRNHHAVGMGCITELATSAPGYTGIRPNTAAPLAEILKLNGYSTSQYGKCHEVPVHQSSPMGPFDAWPTGGGGFEYFYGFISGETNQYYPAIYEGTTPLEPPKTPEEGYHFTEDMTDKAIAWVRQQKSLMPDRPFFTYFAPGATHAPHHVPKDWIDRYRGRFDAGWDALREEIFARQKALGVIPADAELTARPAEIPAWDDMADELKPVLARQMEVYAAFLAHTDYHVGRLIDAIDGLGDSRRHARLLHHRRQRRVGRRRHQRHVQRDVRVQRRGVPRDRRVHGVEDRRVRWARGLQPLRGRLGARDGHALPVDQAGRVALGRHPQRHDRALAERLRRPRGVAVAVLPRHRHRADRPRSRGTARAVVRAWRAADAAPRHEHDLLVRRCRVLRSATTSSTSRCSSTAASTTRDGPRSRVTARRGCTEPPPAIDEDVWELYGPDDWTQAHNIAADNPAKLAELQRLFLIEATKYNVLPLDDRRVERFNADLAGRPVADQGQDPAALRWHGTAQRELRADDQEQVTRDHRERHRARRLVPKA